MAMFIKFEKRNKITPNNTPNNLSRMKQREHVPRAIQIKIRIVDDEIGRSNRAIIGYASWRLLMSPRKWHITSSLARSCSFFLTQITPRSLRSTRSRVFWLIAN